MLMEDYTEVVIVFPFDVITELKATCWLVFNDDPSGVTGNNSNHKSHLEREGKGKERTLGG